MEGQDTNQRQDEQDGFKKWLAKPVYNTEGRPDSPSPSCVSMKSDASMSYPYNFSQEIKSNDKSVERADSPSSSCSIFENEQLEIDRGHNKCYLIVDKTKRPGSPSPSCVSMKRIKSEVSLIRPYHFSQEEQSNIKSVKRSDSLLARCGSQESDKLEINQGHNKSYTSENKTGRPDSPSPSFLSLKSDSSMFQPLTFSQGERNDRKSVKRSDSLLVRCGSQESDKLETNQGHNKTYTAGRPDSPSFVSLKSERSLIQPYNFSQEEKSDAKSIERPNSPVESNNLMQIIHFDITSEESFIYLHLSAPVPQGYYVLSKPSRDQKKRLCLKHFLPLDVYCQSDQSLMCKNCATMEHRGHNKSYTLDAQILPELDTKTLLEQTLNSLDKDKFISYLCQEFPECFETPSGSLDVHELSKTVLEKLGSEMALKIALKSTLDKGCDHKTTQDHLKSELQNHLKSIYKYINEGNALQGNPISLNKIFTELHITEGEDGGINKEHEVRQLEEASKNKNRKKNTIKCNDIFKPLPGQNKRIRTVLTKGIAGIGKTVSVQNFILEWAEEKANQDVHFIFPLPFRDLNLKSEAKFSAMQLLHHYFPQIKDLKTIRSEETKTVFILDGLDECRLPLNFKNNEMCSDLTKEISVDVLLTNLIQGNILPSALLWITSRPAAVSLIPSDCVHQITEVCGFQDRAKEDYFRKRFNGQDCAEKIVAHIKSSRSLHIMCHIPVFCWISAMVLERTLEQADMVPKTLTQMYTHFLLIQTHLKNKKYHGEFQDDLNLKTPDKEMIIKLGKLAFLQLNKGHLIFYEKDLIECGIDASRASEYSSICTQIFKEEFGLYLEKVFCFVHLSIQEHLAAVYVQLQFLNNNENILTKDPERQSNPENISELHKSAIDLALQSENGHFDLFLRFLLGLSLDSNLKLLKSLLSKSSTDNLEETVDYIKEKIKKESSAERTINLFHCLNELNYNSLVEEIHSFLRSGNHSETELKPDQCSALAFVLLTSEDVMNEFDLKMCNTSLEGYQRLLPVVRTSKKACLAGVSLTDESCEILGSILQSPNAHLTELDLSFNNLGDLGVKLLCAGLSSPHSKLVKLDLSHNELEQTGVKMLCTSLKSPDCKLQILGLAATNFSEQSCQLMASVFEASNLHLKELNLGCNSMEDSGVKLLSTGLSSLQCKLEKLRLDRCDLTHVSCEALKNALQSINSHLKELDLSYNKLDDSGVQQLCDGLIDPNCKLENLDLSYNNLGHSGVKLLTAGLMNPACKLKSIRLTDVSITDESCETLATAFQSTNTHLLDLDLSNNFIGDSGVKMLCAGLNSLNCKLEKLSVCWCNITDKSCSNLASVLSSGTCLAELDLRDNDLQDSGVKLLCVGLQHPQCNLQRLGLSGCCVTEEGCCSLAVVLSSDHSKLKELDLSYNHLGESGVKQLSAVRDDPHLKLGKLSVAHGGACRIKPGLKKYAFEVTLDPNTAHRTLLLNNNKHAIMKKEEQPYPDHKDRFEFYSQVLCKEAMSDGRFYWEAEWTGTSFYMGVTYKGINRKGRSRDCKLGMNKKSWIMFCSVGYGCYASYDEKEIVLTVPPNPCKRMGVYLDWQAGTLSFFIILAGKAHHMYTYHTKFTEPLYPGIRVQSTLNDSVKLCELE